MQIIPTTGLQKRFDEAEERIAEVKDVSRWIQVDVGDGVFAEGKTFELELLGKSTLDTDNVLWDIHLMVKEPTRWIEKCMFVEAARVIGQVEMMGDCQEFVDKVKSMGMEAGVAFDIETPIDNIPIDVDLVVVMGRKAGFGEYPLEEKIYKKIKILRQAQDDKDCKFKIAVDGGVTAENVSKLAEAGADICYCGNEFENIYDCTH